MQELGYNYRITDFQCALGISQLKKLPGWIALRREIASRYDEAFRSLPRVNPLSVRNDVSHVYHLYVVRLDRDDAFVDRSVVFHSLREAGIGVNVHYIPVHLHPFYRDRFGTHAGLCPVAEEAYERIISIPMYPLLKRAEQDYIIETIRNILG